MHAIGEAPVSEVALRSAQKWSIASKSFNTAGKYLLLSLAMPAAVLSFVPLSISGWSFPNMDCMSVDAAFLVALPELFNLKAQYGREVLFTYGPWGFVVMDLGPYSAFGLAVILNSLVIAAVVAAFYDLLRTANRRDQIALSIYLALLYYLWWRGLTLVIWFVPCFYSLIKGLCDDSSRRRARDCLFPAAVAFLAGWSDLTKFNVFLFGGFVYGALFVKDVLNRRVPTDTIAWLFGTTLGWIAAGQNPANIVSWIIGCMNLSGGYSEAMSKGFYNPYSWTKVAAFYSGIALFIGLAAMAASLNKSRSNGLLLLLVMGLFAYSALQHAIGGNQIEQAAVELLAAAWFLWAVTALPSSKPLTLPMRSAFTVLVLIVSIIEIQIVREGIVHFGPARPWLSVVTNQANAAFHLVKGDAEDRRNYWNQLLQSIRESMPVPATVKGTADVYPQHTGVVIADPDLKYTPRPAYLSLNAHTKRLADANADHLRKTPPDFVLFQVLLPSRSVHHRHPATDDGPSWPELLTRYSLEGLTEGKLPASEFLILKHRSEPTSYRFEPLIDRDVRWGETIDVPQGKLVWAVIDVSKSLVGRATKTVYKSPHVYLESYNGDTLIDRYQIVPELGRAGFLAAPLVTDTPGFASLFERTGHAPLAGDLQSYMAKSGNKPVTKVRVTTEDGTAWFWQDQLRLQLSEIVFSSDKPTN